MISDINTIRESWHVVEGVDKKTMVGVYAVAHIEMMDEYILVTVVGMSAPKYHVVYDGDRFYSDKSGISIELLAELREIVAEFAESATHGRVMNRAILCVPN